MAIQWFPGHMTSARKKAAETMARIDVVIEVVDARLPEASSNPMIHELRVFRNRPCLKVLNKADLADPAATKEWLAWYSAQPGVKAVAISGTKAGEASRLPALCQSLAPHRNDTLKPLRMMIMGIPNVGKSTLMNTLVKRRIAAVGDEPAITKSQQIYELSPRQSIVDTPGMMWPKIAHESDGLMLAAGNAIGRNAIIDEEVGTFLAGLVLARYPGALAGRYGFSEDGMDGVAALEAIARKRGCFIKGRGAEPDMERSGMILLTDFRDGRLGRISLETPASRADMLAAPVVRRETEALDSADDVDEA